MYPTARPLSGFFLKKKPPCRPFAWAREFWFCSIGRALVDTRASPATRVQPRHLRRNSAFIEENQLFKRDRTRRLDELFPAFAVGFRVAFLGVERPFLQPQAQTPHHTPQMWGAEAARTALFQPGLQLR